MFINKSNVFLIVLDTFRSDFVDLEKGRVTPSLAEFADDATVYSNAYSQGCWSVSAHASIFTGKYPSEHRATSYSPFLYKQKALAEELSDLGYSTYAVTSNYYVNGFTGLDRGFDIFKKTSRSLIPRKAQRIFGRLTSFFMRRPYLRKTVEALTNWYRSTSSHSAHEKHERLSQKVLDKTENLMDKAGPNFYFVNFIDAHLPRSPKNEFREQFVDKELEDVEVPKDERVLHYEHKQITDEQVEKMKQLYKADVKTVDQAFGKLIDQIKEKDIYNESMIVVVSDHGEGLGEKGLIGHFFNFDKETISVPLLIKYPRQKDKQEVEKPVETRRIFHTILNRENSLENLEPIENVESEFVSPGIDLEKMYNSKQIEFDKSKSGNTIRASIGREGLNIRFEEN